MEKSPQAAAGVGRVRHEKHSSFAAGPGAQLSGNQCQASIGALCPRARPLQDSLRVPCPASKELFGSPSPQQVSIRNLAEPPGSRPVALLHLPNAVTFDIVPHVVVNPPSHKIIFAANS